jgi:hypothetical protein
MGKQSVQHSIDRADPFNDPEWTFIMACAWVAHRVQAGVEAATRGFGGITRAAVERLIKELRIGRLTAWARVDGKAFPIAPQHWRALEPIFVRKRLLPGFAESFGRLMVTVRDGTDKDIRDLTISSESLKQIFPTNGFANAYRVRQPQRERARMGLEGRFGQKIPPPAEMSNGILCKEVTRWLAENKPLPKNSTETSNDSILRAARRKK